MRLLLLLLLLTSAKLIVIDANLAWVFPGEHNGIETTSTVPTSTKPTEKDKILSIDFVWINEVLGTGCPCTNISNTTEKAPVQGIPGNDSTDLEHRNVESTTLPLNDSIIGNNTFFDQLWKKVAGVLDEARKNQTNKANEKQLSWVFPGPDNRDQKTSTVATTSLQTKDIDKNSQGTSTIATNSLQLNDNDKDGQVTSTVATPSLKPNDNDKGSQETNAVVTSSLKPNDNDEGSQGTTTVATTSVQAIGNTDEAPKTNSVPTNSFLPNGNEGQRTSPVTPTSVTSAQPTGDNDEVPRTGSFETTTSQVNEKDRGSQETSTEEPNKNDTGQNDDETTKWINEVLGIIEGNTTNGLKPNLTTTSINSCTTTDGKDGKCVKPQYCLNEIQERDSTTLFTLRETSCKPLYQCCALDDVKPAPVRNKTLPSGCGWTNPGGYGLRTTDSEGTGFSNFGEFPWMIALLKNIRRSSWVQQDYIGGGTLIHPAVVLTVAHKVDYLTANKLKCRAGEWDTTSNDEIAPYQDRSVRRIAIHGGFQRVRALYDAALLFLKKPFNLEGVYHIGVACLARDMPLPGTLCYSMGWGSTAINANSTFLKKIRLPMVDPETCQRQLRNTHLGSDYFLHHTLCCAGGEAGKDTCVGDGGSPLVCPISSDNGLKKYAVYGMVVYGVSCGEKDVPGVYAKVSSMTDWVDRQMQGEDLDPKIYSIV